MKINKIVALGAITLALYACGSDEEKDTASQNDVKKKADTDTTTNVKEDVERIEFDVLFANVPSPFALSKQIESLNIQDDGQMLHDYEKASSYDTERKMALNLGIYAADLTYSNIMQTGAEEIQYLGAILYLTDHLGIGSVLDADTKIAFEESIGDKDKSLSIINDTYADLEGYLREERRENLAAYMMAGGMIEILYMGTNLAEVNDELLQMMSDQSNGINTLVEIAGSLKNVDEIILKDMAKIKAIYDQMEIVEATEDTVEAEGDEVVIGPKPSARLSQAQFEELKELVADIRSSYTE